MRIKTGDTADPIVVDATYRNADGTISVADLTGFQEAQLIARQGTAVLFTDTAPTVDAPNGVVTHNWVAGQTDTPGRLWVRVRVKDAAGKWRTFPAFGELAVDIEE